MTPPCPRCDLSLRYLPDSSSVSRFMFFRCDHCGHVFNAGKDSPATITQITVEPRPRGDFDSLRRIRA